MFSLLSLKYIYAALLPYLPGKTSRALYAEGLKDGRALSGGTLYVKSGDKNHAIHTKRREKAYVRGFHAGLDGGYRARGMKVALRLQGSTLLMGT